MAETPFTGDRKVPLRSPLASLEKWIIERNVRRFPRWIEGYHLTLVTILWSVGVVLFGYLAQFSLHWLWASSAMFAGQWFTDSFDGALGRLRDTGIPKWGFYMDHLLDFVFMWCAPVGYVFLVDDRTVALLFVFAFIYSALNANAFLTFGATGAFKITYLGMGPTEIRLVYIALNALVVFLGPGILETAMPYAVALSGLLCASIVFRTQRRIWATDMAARQPPSG